jgi:lysophospholipase L1-like esterase
MRRALGAALAVGASLVAALAVLEIGLRASGAPPPADPPERLYVPDPELGHVHAPSVDTVQRASDFEVAVRTNALGLRDAERGAKPLGVFRIVSLGDSYAFGYGVEAWETYAALLEQELGSRHFQVINAGVSGYGTFTETRLLLRLAPVLEPDLVLVALFTGNDLVNNLRASGRLGSALEHSRFAWLGERSRLFAFAWTRSENLELKWRSAESVEITRRAIDGLIGACRARALPLAVLLVTPSPASLARFDQRAGLRSWLDARLGYDPRAEIEAVRAHLAERKTPVLETFPLLEADPDPASLELPASEHWTPRAHALVAHALASFLRERALVPWSRPPARRRR